LKNPILNAFNQAATTYETHGQVNHEIAQQFWTFVQRHLTFKPATIIDIGCGPRTFLTQQMIHQIPCFLTDGAPRMVERALHNSPAAHGLVMDAAFPSLNCPGALAVSNMAFQWLSDFPNALERYKGQVQVLAFSLPIFGSFHEWQNWCQRRNIPYKMNTLLTQETLEAFCYGTSPQSVFIDTADLFVPYDKPLSFLRDLKYMGAHVSLAKSDSQASASLYQARQPDAIFKGITYRVAYVLIGF
jgi:hypothetical protein